jgi:cyclopropane fatty-acyl-phospholipid synthase-like methyltransferase
MKQQELISQFDHWAHSYDQEVEIATSRFPFAGYEQTLSTVWEQARVTPGMTVLDLGVGTGNLARLFVESGCQVLGVDFSSEMLAKAGAKLPQLELLQADLTLDEWPLALNRRFDRIVSNYVFHEFPVVTKMHLLSWLARNNLTDRGRIVIGDIAFPTAAYLQRIREEVAGDWEDEFYWLTDETRDALEPAGWKVKAFQISFCTAVYTFEPPTC